MLVRLLLLGTLRAALAGREIAFLGAAGCDDADTACDRDSDSAHRVVWTYALTQAGGLHPARNLTVPGTPAWLVAPPHAPGCLFATLADVGSVASFVITEHGAEGPKVVLPSGGENPVYAAVTADGQTLLVANYGPEVASKGAASVASFRIGSGCSLEAAAVVPHSGSSVVPGRQAAAHPHSFVPVGDGLAYACDLGQDAIVTYAVGVDSGLRELNRVRADPGEGPRHLVRHPSRPLVFVVNELASSITTYSQGERGALTRLANASTLPPGEAREGSKAAEILISPDGGRLYASNRGRVNSVCVLEILQDGSLRQVQQMPVPVFPRGMQLARDGALLLVAGQHKGVVQTFLTQGAGGLAPTGTIVEGPPTTAAIAVVSSAGGPADEALTLV